MLRPTRRTLVAAPAALLLAGVAGRPRQHRHHGCFARSRPARAASGSSIDELPPMIKGSPDAAFDKALGRVLGMIAQTFGTSPLFGYYDDGEDLNALADPLPEPQGTVLFGLNMRERYLREHQNGDIAILGICAHEFAHTLQFRNGTYDELRLLDASVKYVELHADYLTGYFLGAHRSYFHSVDYQFLGSAWQALGDTWFNREEHHGTPEQRVRAIEAGYIHSTRTAEGIDEAARQGALFVRTL